MCHEPLSSFFEELETSDTPYLSPRAHAGAYEHRCPALTRAATHACTRTTRRGHNSIAGGRVPRRCGTYSSSLGGVVSTRAIR